MSVNNNVKIQKTLSKYVTKKRTKENAPWYNFHVYDLFSNPVDCRYIIDSIISNIEYSLDSIDCFIPIPKSGIPIATLFHWYFSKPMMIPGKQYNYSKNSTLEFNQPCLVDSSINRRGSFLTTITDLTELKITPHYFIVLLYNDRWPLNNEKLNEFISNDRLFYLSTISELIENKYID